MLTSDQLQMQELARAFAAAELRPYAAEWDAERGLPDELFEKLAGMGFLGMRLPESAGGLGLDLPTYALVLETLAWGDPSVALAVAIHNGPVTHAVARFGTEAQRERWLAEMAQGGTLGALALSEDETGSDTRAISLRATPDEGGWRLTGTKRWVTNGERAGLLIVLARTGGDPGEEEGISAFLVPRDPDTIPVSRRERMLGFSAAGAVSLSFDEVRVPRESLLGEEGAGYQIAAEALDLGRIGVAALALGISQAALEHALTYASERQQFETPIWEFGGIQEKLAGMAIPDLRRACAHPRSHGAGREGAGGGGGLPAESSFSQGPGGRAPPWRKWSRRRRRCGSRTKRSRSSAGTDT
jgi:alkylation response protein AidB-like acyl-CoA dehydrogenase